MNEIFVAARTSPIVRILAFVAGDLAVQHFKSLPADGLIGIIFLFALLLCLRRAYLPACFLLGLCWSSAYAAIRLDEALPAQLEKRDLWVEGVISGLPQPTDEGVRFDFRVTWQEGVEAIPALIRLNWYRRAPQLQAGERWRLRVRLKRPHGYYNPGGLDYEQWLFARGIRATGYVREDPGNLELAADAGMFSRSQWRQRLRDRLDAALAETEFRGIIQALTMGEESAISPTQWQVLRRTGTSHLVAVSGSHIGLIAALGFFLALKLCAGVGLKRWSPPTVAAFGATAMATAYAALADFAIPTQRALVMLAIVMGGIVWRRNLRPAHTLAVALLAVTVYEPLAVLASGFWLSFGAVTLILFTAAGRLRIAGGWRGLWKMNWVTAVGLGPLLLLFFQQVSLISPVANLLAIPTLGVILTPWCLLSAIVLVISSGAGEWMFALAAHFLSAIWQLLEWLSSLPFAQWRHLQPPAWALGFAVTGVLLILSPRGVPGRWLGLILLAPSLTFRPAVPAQGSFRLTLLDVGQGLSAVVRTEHHTLVFDTGARFSPGFDMGTAVVEPFLLEQGVHRIDSVVISHGDNDHSGGAQSLFDRFPVAQVSSSVAERFPGGKPCLAGQHWQWDGIGFDMLSPFDSTGSDNDSSCVLKIWGSGGCLLLTGDIEKNAERRLVERYEDRLRCDIIVVPHHGSRTSSTALLLGRVRPRLALIPAGYLNRFGFPAREVVERYGAVGAKILNTASAGAITVNIDGLAGVGMPSRYRDTHARYWNDRP